MSAGMNKATLCPHFPWDFPGPTPGAGAEEGPSRQSSGCRPGSPSASQPSGRRGSKVRVTSGLRATRHPDNQLKEKKKTPQTGKGESIQIISRYLSGRRRPSGPGPRGRLSRDFPAVGARGPTLRKAGAAGGEHVGFRARQEVGPVHGGRRGEDR